MSNTQLTRDDIKQQQKEQLKMQLMTVKSFCLQLANIYHDIGHDAVIEAAKAYYKFVSEK